MHDKSLDLRDIDSLVPARNFSRRDFVSTAAGSGFAAAVLPVGAQTINTDTRGLDAGPVEIAVGAFKLPAYRAKPQGKSKLPVVLVVSEIFGVHEHIADVARRFAKLGYLAVAPELFVRQGDARSQPDVATLIKEVVSKVPDAQVMTDLDATVAWAGTEGGDLTKVGITGFCWGGRITWLYAAHAPVKAGVAWYGRLVGNASELTPRHPVDAVSQLRAPVLGLYGGIDQGIPLDTVDNMLSLLPSGSTAAKQSKIKVFDNAGHAFHADYRPSYRKDDAQEGWQDCLEWFRTHGVA